MDKILKRFKPDYNKNPYRLKKYLLIGTVLFSTTSVISFVIGWLYEDASYFTMGMFPLILSGLMIIHRGRL